MFALIVTAAVIFFAVVGMVVLFRVIMPRMAQRANLRAYHARFMA